MFHRASFISKHLVDPEKYCRNINYLTFEDVRSNQYYQPDLTAKSVQNCGCPYLDLGFLEVVFDQSHF